MTQQQESNVVTSEELKALAAQKSGQDQDRIGGVTFELRSLRETGILVKATVGGTHLFSRKASLSELGIPVKSVRGKNNTAGSRFMGPPEFVRAQKSLAESIRNVVKRHGQEVTGFDPYWYIHWKIYDKFIKEWNEKMAKFDEQREYAIENLDTWRDEYRTSCTAQAHEAWKSLHGRRKSALNLDLGKAKTKKFETKAEFVEWIVTLAMNAFPTKARVEAMMRADYYTAVLLSEADISAEIARKAEADAETQSANTERAESYARQEKAKQQARVAESEADIAMAAIRQAEYDHARNQLENITSPFEELFANLRAQIYEDATEIARSIRDNGFLNPQVGGRIGRLVEMFEMKNATNDRDLSALLAVVQEWAHATPSQTGKRGEVSAADPVALEELEQALDQVIEATHESAVAVARQARAAKQMAMLDF